LARWSFESWIWAALWNWLLDSMVCFQSLEIWRTSFGEARGISHFSLISHLLILFYRGICYLKGKYFSSFVRIVKVNEGQLSNKWKKKNLPQKTQNHKKLLLFEKWQIKLGLVNDWTHNLCFCIPILLSFELFIFFNKLSQVVRRSCQDLGSQVNCCMDLIMTKKKKTENSKF